MWLVRPAATNRMSSFSCALSIERSVVRRYLRRASFFGGNETDRSRSQVPDDAEPGDRWMTLPRTNPLPPNPWPTFALCSLALFLVLLDTTVFSVTFTAMFFGFFFFMTRVWGYALPKAGLAVTPGPLMVIPVAIIAGRRAARIGHRPLLVMGGIIYALGAAWIHAMAGPIANFLRDWLPGMLLGRRPPDPVADGSGRLRSTSSALRRRERGNQSIRQMGP